MARAGYIYIVVLNDGELIPYTVKWEMIQDIERLGLPVDYVLRTKDCDPGYKNRVMDVSEWSAE